MSEFSQTTTSSFPSQNILFNSASGLTGQELQKNQNQLAGQQIDLSNANMAQVQQAAGGLLSAYPDEASRAAAWAPTIGMLQSQGYAMHAPAQYPGEAVLRSLVNQSIPAADQYKLGILNPPGLSDALARASAPPPAYGATGMGTAQPGASPLAIPARGTGGPGASASAPTEWLPYFEEASKATGVPVDLLIAQARQESGFNPNAKGAAGEVGVFQIKPSTAASPGFGLPPVDPASITGPDNVRNNIMFGAQYLKARMGGGDPSNPAVQAAGLHAYNGGGDPNYVANVFRYRPTLAPSDPNAAVTAYTPPSAGTATASATPATAPPGGVAAPGRTQVASTVPVALPAATTEPQPSTGAPPATTAAPAGTPPAATAAPAGTAQPAQPGATPLPGTGINSQQFQTALWKTQQAAQLETQFPNSPAAKAKAAELRAEAALYMQADSVITLPNGIQVKALSGQQVDAAKPRPDWYFDPDAAGGVGAFVDRTGTNKPEVLPARRMSAQPNGDVINDQGKVIFHVDPVQLEKDAEGQYWYVPKYPTTGPDGTPVPPRPVGGNLPTPAFAEEQKVEAKRLSDLRTTVLDRAKESAAANTMIGNTESALQEAQKGNVGPNAMAPQKVQLVAMAKALGIDLAPFGIDTSKLAAAQVTREQLQQLNGAILRKMYPQRITNADLAISGTVLPIYGLDPEALTANFDIYKKQNAYDTRMAQDMLAYQDQHHTLVGWENQWHAKNGFGAGPIDNLFGDAQAGRLTSGGSGSKPAQGDIPVVRNDDDFGKLKSGDKFIDPNGQRRVKP